MGRFHPGAWASCVFVALLAAAPARAADRVTVHGLNQLEYTLYTSSDRDTTLPKEIVEEWLDVDFRVNNVLAGFRYEAFQPHELSPWNAPPDSVREGIVQRYAEVFFDRGSVRAGNFYEIFGRGLLFRSYEERSIRVDNNLDGVILRGSVGPMSGKVFSGRMRDIGPGREDRNDVLHGLDLEGMTPFGVTGGMSYLIQSTRSDNPNDYAVPPQPSREEAIGGRVSYSYDYFDLYLEAGRINRLSGDEPGRGYYGSFSAYPVSFFSITVEGKSYDRFRFSPLGSDTDYNNPPALTRETSYTLISRFPHQLDADDEKGFQVEAVVTPRDGTQITLSRSETAKVDGDLFRNTGLRYGEWYADWREELGENWVVVAAYDYIGDGDEDVRNHTVVLDVDRNFDNGQELRVEYQYQQSEGVATYLLGAGNSLVPVSGFARNHLALIEYAPNDLFTVSLVGEHAMSFDPTEVPKDDFAYAQLDWRITQENYFRFTTGRRQAGFVCVGGVCRYEPAFEGVEMQLLTSF